LETEVASARAWRERTARVFLKKNSHYNLLEVLSPRYEFESCDKLEKKRKRKLLEEHPVRHPIFQGLSAAQLSDPREIVKAFKQAEQDELVGMRALRARNLEAQQSEGTSQPGDEPSTSASCLLDCELCREQFQPGSAALCHTTFGNKGDDGARPQSLRDIKFLCPSCNRSRRPRLETILSLLVSLQKLTVRLPEGEALQCLTERAMAWQDRARTLLAKPIISSALEKLGKSKTVPEDGTEGVGETVFSNPEDVVIDTLEDSTILTLEDIMVEGDLLEVTLDEIKQLWQLLQATPARRAKKLPELDRLEAELVAAREERRKEKIKKRAEQGDDKEERERKRLKKKKREEARLAELQDANSHDDCSASNPKCKRPTGKQVHWVQCDKCELWFHLFCIGLKPNNIKEDEDFYCKNCNGQANKD